MKPIAKRALKTTGVVVALIVAGCGAFVAVECSRFDASLDKVYDVPAPTIVRSSDPVVIARGKHLAESVAACAAAPCHGTDLGGGTPIKMGPIGVFVGPNITGAGLGAAYSDGEFARVITHGLKKDSRSLRFMPSQDFAWLPGSDVTALVSYLRSVPPVDRASGATVVKPLGKVLDRRDDIILDVARRIEHSRHVPVPPPAPTAEYGAFLAHLCVGCHGEHFSGGRIPGAPPSIPTPSNITPDASGIGDWTFDDFDTLMRKAVRKNGKALNPFMPVEAWRNFDDVEMHALWEYLRHLPPMPFGRR
jgi:hypothetical protein